MTTTNAKSLCRMPLTLLVAAVVLAAAGAAWAQSPFSLTNLGGDVSSSDARIDGRGGWGMAESDTTVPSFHNIAGLTGLRRVALVVSGYGEEVSSETDQYERKSDHVRTPTIMAAVPMAGGKVVLSAGFRSLRATQYEYAEVMEWVAADTLRGERYFYREGTQFRIPLGISLRIASGLSVAGSLNIERGVLRDNTINYFFEPIGVDGSMLYNSTFETMEDEIAGTSSTWSLLWKRGPRFSLGVSHTPAYDLDVDRHRTLTGVAGAIDSDMTWAMPATWRAGGHVFLSPRWRFGADYSFQKFSEFSGNPAWEPDMVDAWSFGAGFERIRRNARRGGLGNLPLRMGYSVSRWGYLVEGEEILEHRVSAGTGVPFHGGKGHVDFALTYGWRGDRETQGVEDSFWRFTVSLAGLERWW